MIDKAKEVTDIHVLRLRQLRRDRTENLSQILKSVQNGAVAVSEDGKSVMNARVARQAMRLAAEVGIPVFAHCEDKNLVARGVMNALEICEASDRLFGVALVRGDYTKTYRHTSQNRY